MNPAVRVARFLTASPFHGAAVGAGVGAAASALRGPQYEGESRMGAAFRGARKGALIGGVAGGAGRMYRDTRLLNPALGAGAAVTETAARAGRGIANFGKRQAYGFTGRGNADAIGMAGNHAAATKGTLLRARAADEIKHAPLARHAKINERLQSNLKANTLEGRNSQILQDAGVTSLPGIARSLRDPTRRGTAIKAMGKSLTAGPGGAVMGLGVPALFSAPSILKGDESATGGKTLGQKFRGLGVDIGLNAVTGGLPMIPQAAAALGGSALLNRARRPQPPLPQADGVTQ